MEETHASSKSAVEMADVHFRKMQIEDLHLVMKNENLSYSHPWTQGIFADCIHAGHECWLFLIDKEILGHSVLSVAAGESHLQNVCIHPHHQGKGYGRALVEYMLVCAGRRKAETVFLEVRSSNVIAYKLYESMGFNEVGIRDAYYPGKSVREDAIVFAKELTYGEDEVN